MAKPPMTIHVQSSDFKKLLEVQQLSLEHMQTIRTLVESGAPAKLDEEAIKIQKKQLEQQEELLEVSKVSAEELKRIKGEQAEAISNIAQTVKTFDSIKDKFANFGKGLAEKFGSVRATGTTALKAINVGGVFDKKIASREFADQQKKLGSEKSYKELGQDFETRNKTAKSIKSNEAELDKFKKETGLNDKQIAGTKEGQRLMAKRESLSDAFAKTDLRASLVAKPEAVPAGTEKTNKEQNDAMNVSEEEMESARLEQAQTDLLNKIEKNTSAMGGDKSRAAAPSDGGGGGLLGGIGLGLGALGKGIGKGLESLLGGVGKGLIKLSVGLASLANPATLVGLAAVTLAAIGLGKALELAAPAIEAFAPVLEKVVDVIGNVFIAAIEKIPEVIRAVGEVITGIISGISDAIIGTINAITDSIERLSKVDGMNLAAVGAGLLAVAGGMVAFSAANVAGGIGNLVGGLLSKVSGQKSPVEQIIALGEHGVNIEKAGIGVEKLGVGLTAFSKIDPDKIKAIAALPTDKIAAMGAAMGSANAVSSQSAANDGARTAATAGAGGGGGTSVIAPVTNNKTTQNSIVQLPVRNQEQTMNRYIKTRFA
jgi:hypothetical protein